MTAIRQNRYNEKIGAGVVENLLIQHVTTCKETLIKITNKESISDQDKKELGNSLAALGYVHLDYPPDKSYYVSYDSDSAVKTERAISDFSQTKTDLCRHLAVRIVLGDHDANTGNFQVTKDGRIVGIDFGHVFNNQLLNRGNVNRHNKSNSALDFLNRDYLSLNIELVKRGANTPKIWRDYPALVYSKDMANALAKMGNMEAKGRSNTSKQIFLEIITSIQSGTYKEKSSDWKKKFFL